jgi:hypothetical protein
VGGVNVVTETEKKIEDFIAEEKREEWRQEVEVTINMSPGEERSYGLAIIAEMSKIIIALGDGATMEEALSKVEPGITYMQIGQIVQGVVVYSPRGEDFRRWWNAWHDRVPPPEAEKARVIFNPSRIKYNGKTLIIIGVFDPKLPLTKNPKYPDLVKMAVEAAKGVKPS